MGCRRFHRCWTNDRSFIGYVMGLEVSLRVGSTKRIGKMRIRRWKRVSISCVLHVGIVLVLAPNGRRLEGSRPCFSFVIVLLFKLRTQNASGARFLRLPSLLFLHSLLFFEF